MQKSTLTETSSYLQVLLTSTQLKRDYYMVLPTLPYQHRIDKRTCSQCTTYFDIKLINTKVHTTGRVENSI